jgi:hydrogenase expression/formation protein HypC
MCIAVPGKIISISGNTASVDFSGNIIDVDVRLVDAKAGDYVLVHAGCAIEVMKEAQASDLAALLKEIEGLQHDPG